MAELSWNIVIPFGITENTQADQRSDMNVISTSLAKLLLVLFRPVLEIRFLGLSMETVDRRDTLLLHWCSFEFGTEGLWRTVNCFIQPKVPGIEDVPRLLLGLPWLYDVNAKITIRGSSVQIGDHRIGETLRYTISGPVM